MLVTMGDSAQQSGSVVLFDECRERSLGGDSQNLCMFAFM